MSRKKYRLKKGDIVVHIIGEDKGKRGKILSINSEKDTAIVEGTNLVKKHLRPRRQGEQGGIIEKEAPVHISNIKLICPKCGQPTRVQKAVLEDNSKVRVCNKCGEFVD
jgi:large subunit ribosomal protein L24